LDEEIDSFAHFWFPTLAHAGGHSDRTFARTDVTDLLQLKHVANTMLE